MRRVSRLDYYTALSNYFYKTKGYVYPAISDKIVDELNTIRQYEELHGPIKKREAFIRVSLNLFAQLIGLIVFSILIIYVIKEVFHFTISYTPKNILLLTLAIIAFKVKFRLAKAQ